jgi:toluene monooxygenase electron transfer component
VIRVSFGREVGVKIVVTGKNGAADFACEHGEKILHAALRAGIELPYECATGTCGTCKAKVVSGRTESAWPDAPGKKYLKTAADILTCQSVAHEDCALEVFALKTRESAVAPGTRAGILRGLRSLTHDVVAFDVELDAPMDFDAGQFALLIVPGIAGARAYSMVNFERATRRLSFIVKKKPGGGVSEWLFGGGAVDGTTLHVFGPVGHAIFQTGTEKHVLCIAGGSGIAGMMSILAHACGADHFAAWDGHVFFGVRAERDTFFLDELEAFRACANGRLAITIALSDEDVPDTLRARYPAFSFARGFVHAVAGETMKDRFAGVRAYVAGPPPMVDASLRLLLREARLPPADIRYDKFS